MGATWLKYVILRYNLHQVSADSVDTFDCELSCRSELRAADFHHQRAVLRQAGRPPVRTLLISSSGYDPYRVQFTTRDFAAQHPDVVARFVRASKRGWQEYLRDPSATNAYLLKLNPALNPAQEAFTAQALRDGDFITGGDASGAQIGRMTAARWQATYEQLKALGILQGPLDPSACPIPLKFRRSEASMRSIDGAAFLNLRCGQWAEN